MPMFVRGEGCYLWDLENRRYLDMTAGIAVTSLGHCDPAISRIFAQQVVPYNLTTPAEDADFIAQSGLLLHTSNLYHQPWVGTLSKLMVTKTREAGGMRSASKVFICNSGTEANEAALKFARKVGKMLNADGSKHEIVSFTNSFHGRTWGALSATPNAKYQKPFSPMVGGFRHGSYNDVESLDRLITERTCGVIVEPIQGEGGINVATPEFLTAIRKRCDETGAVLIYDEIQCGLSRTGHLWAHQLYSSPASSPPPSPHAPQSPGSSSGSAVSNSASFGPHPDIITTAKALGNGYPIGATMVNDYVADKIVTGDHGTTFGGNPLGCRLAHHIFERLSDPSLQADVRRRSEVLRGHLERLKNLFPNIVSSPQQCSLSPSTSSSSSSSPSPLPIQPQSQSPSHQQPGTGREPRTQQRSGSLDGTIRGHGLILGLQLNRDPTPIVTAARERGLLMLSCGTNTLRFVPPLVIDSAQIDEGMSILEEAMRSVE